MDFVITCFYLQSMLSGVYNVLKKDAKYALISGNFNKIINTKFLIVYLHL